MKLFVACDIKYFRLHGIEFCKSAAETGNTVLAVIFPTMNENINEQIGSVQECIEALQNEIMEKSVVIEVLDTKLYLDLQNFLDVRDMRAFYACMRFIILDRYLDQLPFLVVDIDSIVNKEVKVDSSYDLGVYLRENNDVGGNSYEKQGMKLAAGAVYVTDRAKAFIHLVHDYFLNNPIMWFADQHSLYSAYLKVKDTYKIIDFSKENPPFIDWEFDDPDSIIYTGKGDRKYSDQKYLAIKKKYTNEAH